MKVIDLLVPLSKTIYLKNVRVTHVLFRSIPQTWFVYWLCSLIPYVGTLVYGLILIPLSVRESGKKKWENYLLHYVVILIGFGGLWSFFGHFFLAEMVAKSIGWTTSPFQTELAFFTLGMGVAGIMSIWYRGHMLTGLVITKSIFWYGAAYTHITHAISHKNYALGNVGSVLVGDIVYPTILLWLLYKTLQVQK